ncbi:MAG: hypothetical protein WDZ50_04620 [Woeseia sp.]
MLASSIALGACNVALAAPGWSASCSSVAQQLKSVDIAPQQWAVERVDLITTDTDTIDDFDERTTNTASPATPLLFLTPRVANILENIFAESSDAPTAVSEAVPTAVAAGDDSATRRQDSADTVGDAADLHDLDYAIQHGAMRESMYNIDSLPRFQRPMYRTDI